MNSLYVLLAFLAFTALGYMSQVRILYKLHFSNKPLEFAYLRSASEWGQLLRYLAQSTFFVSLPAVSFLLYWGWGPALLWLVVFHLLAETLLNLLLAPAAADDGAPLDNESLVAGFHPADFFTDFSNGRGATRALLAELLLLFSLAMVVSLLAKMIDQQSGLIFALIGVFLAIQLSAGQHSRGATIVRLIASIGVISLGLVFSKQLGIAIYGVWNPIPDWLPWLDFSNASILALLLIIAGAKLNLSAVLTRGLHTLVGALIVVLLLAMVSLLAWHQPGLDAPLLNSTPQSAKLPAFMSLFLFIGSGLLALLARLAWSSNRLPEQSVDTHEFFRFQGLSIFQLLFALVLCLSLASAAGIGAWNTHYLHWDDMINVQQHFLLAISSLRETTAVGSTSASNALTLFTAGLCLIGFSLLVFLFRKLQEIAASARERQKPDGQTTLVSLLASNQVWHGTVIFIVACYFLHSGIRLPSWLALNALGWLILCDYLCASAAELRSHELIAHVFRGFAIGITAIGALQLLWILLRYLLQGDYAAGLAALGTLVAAGVLCGKNLLTIAQQFGTTTQPNLFDR